MSLECDNWRILVCPELEHIPPDERDELFRSYIPLSTQYGLTLGLFVVVLLMGNVASRLSLPDWASYSAVLPLVGGWAIYFYVRRRHLRVAIRQHLRRAGVPICLECGYRLEGNTSGVCPECGEQI